MYSENKGERGERDRERERERERRERERERRYRGGLMSFNGGRVSGSENLEIVPVCMRRRMRGFKVSVCMRMQACVSAHTHKHRV
jgi:hypothetical protein